MLNRMLVRLSVVLAILVFDSAWAVDSPVVRTKSGAVRGKLVQLASATQDVYQFTAIPFAEPPVGNLRFKKPVPKTSWTDVLDATTVTKCCMQTGGGGGGDPNSPYSRYTASLAIPGTIQSEDCLYLNVWVPRATLDSVTSGKDTPQLAVYVYIHGGSFVSGTTMWTLYNGTVVSGMDNIILVTIQYRVGVFGFGYVGKNNDAPGNVGLWDQMEAMRWVKENIEAFGGNSSRITIGGESAGAGSVAYHLISPQSRNYFNQAIIESGSAIAPWAYHTPSTAVTITDLILGQVAPKCNVTRVGASSSIADKLKCLRAVDAMTLAIADAYPMGVGYISGSIPVIEGDFVPRDPLQMITSRDFYQCPLLIGANKDEGMHLLANEPHIPWLLPGMANPNASIDNLNMTHFEMFWQFGYVFVSGVPMPQSIDPTLAEAIRLHYWSTREPGYPKGADVLQAAGQITGDYALICPTYNWADITAKIMKNTTGAPVYVYRYSYQPMNMNVTFFPQWMGVMHGAELPMVFGEPFAPYAASYGYSEDDKLLSRKMIEYWGNFIKYGDPNVRDQYGSCGATKKPTGTLEVIGNAFNNAFNAILPGVGRIVPNKCSLRNWEPYLGKKCDSQIAELNVPNQNYDRGDAVTCGFKVRDCTFWGDFVPKLAQLQKNALRCPAANSPKLAADDE